MAQAYRDHGERRPPRLRSGLAQMTTGARACQQSWRRCQQRRCPEWESRGFRATARTWTSASATTASGASTPPERRQRTDVRLLRGFEVADEAELVAERVGHDRPLYGRVRLREGSRRPHQRATQDDHLPDGALHVRDGNVGMGPVLQRRFRLGDQLQEDRARLDIAEPRELPLPGGEPTGKPRDGGPEALADSEVVDVDHDTAQGPDGHADNLPRVPPPRHGSGEGRQSMIAAVLLATGAQTARLFAGGLTTARLPLSGFADSP